MCVAALDTKENVMCVCVVGGNPRQVGVHVDMRCVCFCRDPLASSGGGRNVVLCSLV